MTNAPAPIGHNGPPQDILYSETVDSLYEEAGHFLDGEGVQTQEQADAVGKLIARLRQVAADAEKARKVEKEPHLAAGREVDARWKPITDKAELATSTAKRALTPFLQAQERAQREAADKARQEAEERAKQAREAELAANPADLSDAAATAARWKEAARVARDADRLEKARPQAAGEGRAIGLRTSYRAELVDPVAFGKWAWANRPNEYTDFLGDLAQRESRLGDRGLPGVIVHEERKAA